MSVCLLVGQGKRKEWLDTESLSHRRVRNARALDQNHNATSSMVIEQSSLSPSPALEHHARSSPAAAEQSTRPSSFLTTSLQGSAATHGEPMESTPLDGLFSFSIDEEDSEGYSTNPAQMTGSTLSSLPYGGGDHSLNQPTTNQSSYHPLPSLEEQRDQTALDGLLHLSGSVAQSQTDAVGSAPLRETVPQIEDITSWSNINLFVSLYLQHQHCLLPLLHKSSLTCDVVTRLDRTDEVFRAMLLSLGE